MNNTNLHVLNTLADELAYKGFLNFEDIEQLRSQAKTFTDAKGYITSDLQMAIIQIEKEYASHFTKQAKDHFQTLVAELGGKLLGPIDIPEDNIPLWHKTPSEFENYRSTTTMPPTVDYLIIGAGLTGVATAYHLAAEIMLGKSIVILEAGSRPAYGASGRNGGNIEAMKESFLFSYKGFVETQKDFINNCFANLTAEMLQYHAERQSKILLEFSRDNVRIVREILKNEKIEADACFDGWLRIPTTEEEAIGILEEVAFVNNLGMKFDLWSPQQIKEETGINTSYCGRFIKESGNFHPGKFIDGIVKNLITRGTKLYTNTQVLRVTPTSEGCYTVVTNKGKLVAKKVILATNAYTCDILPDLIFIEPRVSHILNFAHVENVLKKSYTITTDSGDLYWNYPKSKQYVCDGVKRGMLNIGGGLDTPIALEQLHHPPFIKEIYEHVRNRAVEFLPFTKDQPPLTAWSGVMGFTRDHMPIISFYIDPQGKEHLGLIIAMGCNGYGGSQTIKVGQQAAELARTGRISKSMPDDVFSIKRFISDKPLF